MYLLIGFPAQTNTSHVQGGAAQQGPGERPDFDKPKPAPPSQAGTSPYPELSAPETFCCSNPASTPSDRVVWAGPRSYQERQHCPCRDTARLCKYDQATESKHETKPSLSQPSGHDGPPDSSLYFTETAKGNSKFISEAEALSQTTYQLKKPFVLI